MLIIRFQVTVRTLVKPLANFLDPGLFEDSSVIFRQHSQLALTWPRTKVCQNGY